MRNSIILCSIMIIALSGCMTAGNRKLDDVSNYLSLREQHSTKADVYNVFGQPHDIRSIDSGDTVWVYYKVASRMSAWTFVPYVGMLAGGTARKMTFSYFAFDSSGTLQNVQSKTNADYENMHAGLVRGLSRASDKTQAQRVREEMEKLGRPFDDLIAKSVEYLRDK